MAVTDTRRIKLKLPNLDDIDEAQVRVAYNRLADTLWVSLVGDPRRAYNVYTDDADTMFRVDPYTGEVVGLEIEHFLDRALRLSPDVDEADGQ